MSDRPELRAPRDDGAVLAAPPLAEAGALLAANRRRSAEAAPPGLPWYELQRSARRAAVEAARAYHVERGEPLPELLDADSLIVAGHQPELFHPGVWVKHFALNGLGRQHGVTPLNLVVDNDTMKSTALRLPARATETAPWPHAVAMAFDRWTGEIPWEERSIQEPRSFGDFAERAGAVLAGWSYRPLLESFWPEVLRQAAHTRLVGECFALARRAFERRWGCHNLELPVSALCRTAPFAGFAGHLLSELPRFHAIYNECVHDYRRQHGIKSLNHPVPDLATDGDWLETPFWGWRAGATRRGRLFARRVADTIQLRLGAGASAAEWPALPAASQLRTAEAWQALEAAGCKIRSRALANTLYARLFLSDLFVHGIGGGKYDELTNNIIRRFYCVPPPAFLVLSATRWLPLPRFPATQEEVRRLARASRDLHWNPQRYVEDAPLRELARQRAEWVARAPADKAGRQERYRAIRALSEQLRAPLAERERRLRAEQETCAHQVEANAVLTRRDYSFVLFPVDALRPFCTQFL